MATLSIIDNKYAKLVYDTEEKIVHHQFHKELNSENLQLILNTGMELLREHGANKWLSDNRAIEPHSEEDGRWISEQWLPKVLAVGWKYWALVVPHDVKARMNLFEHMAFFDGKGVRINVFTDIDQARVWLESVDHS